MKIVVTCRDRNGRFKTFGCDVPADCTELIIDMTDEDRMCDGTLLWGFKDEHGRLHQICGELLE